MIYRIYSIASTTFRESIRNKALYSVLAFAIFTVGVATLYGSVSIGETVKVIKDFGLFSLSFFGSIICMLIGVSLLTKEIKQKTIYNILSKPTSRSEFIVGKFFGLLATVYIQLLLMGIMLISFAAFYQGEVDWCLAQGILFSLLEVTLVASVVIFFSTQVITTTLCGLLSLGTYIAGRSIDYLSYFIHAEGHFSETIKLTTTALKYILPNFSILNFSNNLVYGQPATPNYLAWALLYTTCYSSFLLLVACQIFKKRELT